MSLEDLFGPQPDEPERPAGREGREQRAPREPRPTREPKPPREPRQPKPPREPRTPGGGGGSRMTLILGIVAAVLAVAVVAVVGFALTRPSDSAQPAPSAPSVSTDDASVPASTPSSTPSPTTTAAATGVAFSATGFTLTSASGQPFTYRWADEPTAAVAALTAAFGAPPTQRTQAGNGSTLPDYTVYAWNGFSLFEMVPTATLTRADFSQPAYALFTANEVGGVPVTAEFGLKIGMSAAEVRALTPAPASETPRPSGSIRFAFDPQRSSFKNGTPSYSVFADTDGADGPVGTILYFYAPQ